MGTEKHTQLSLFDFSDNSTIKFQNYTYNNYIEDVKNYGLEKLWNAICEYILKYGENEILNISNFGQMYEVGLAITDKNQKKNSGQYYTPNDVSRIMAAWFDGIDAENVCDVGCGTGNLILAYFDFIGEEKTKMILKNGNLYLYDEDKVALNICKTSILSKYGIEFGNSINTFSVDFLNKNVVLPENSKVICNPPYASVTDISRSWIETEIFSQTKELYALFAEKILCQSQGAVIITPYSFIGGKKFYPLRNLMNNYNGFIVSFDNVPGNIFKGRKHGIFNSNTSNSVRAAITVVENKPVKKGFKLSPLIRFKNSERDDLLKCEVLESLVFNDYQVVDKNNPMYYKCDNRVGHIFKSWLRASKKCLNDYVNDTGKFAIYMPNTCRYFTAAANHPMKRSGQIELHFDDIESFSFVYCLINSSFAYWHWRLYDGGITYQKGLLLSMPMFFDLLSEEDRHYFVNLAQEMMQVEENYIIRKNNVGIQENIKYPREYRDKINQKLLSILSINDDAKIFDVVHSNSALEVSV